MLFEVFEALDAFEVLEAAAISVPDPVHHNLKIGR